MRGGSWSLPSVLPRPCTAYIQAWNAAIASACTNQPAPPDFQCHFSLHHLLADFDNRSLFPDSEMLADDSYTANDTSRCWPATVEIKNPGPWATRLASSATAKGNSSGEASNPSNGAALMPEPRRSTCNRKRSTS